MHSIGFATENATIIKSMAEVTIQLKYQGTSFIANNPTDKIHKISCIGVPILMKSKY